jgi:hypothetical protein
MWCWHYHLLNSPQRYLLLTDLQKLMTPYRSIDDALLLHLALLLDWPILY